MEILSINELCSDLVHYVSRIVAFKQNEEASTQEINISEDDKIIIENLLQLAKAASIEKLIVEVLSLSSKIFDKKQETDIEGCFSIISALVLKLDEGKQITMLEQIVKCLKSSESQKSKLRLRILVNLFNKLRGKLKLQYTCLYNIIHYASLSNNLLSIKGYLSRLDDEIDTSKLTIAQNRKLQLLVSETMKKINKESADWIRETARYLKTFQGCNTNELLEAKSAAVEAAVGVIQSPIKCLVARIDIFKLDAIEQLKNDPQTVQLYNLLDIFGNKLYKDYLEFSKLNMDSLKKYGIDHEACIANMRLLTLCSFPDSYDDIPYTMIMENLQVSEEEVEHWVVKAVTSNLIKAKVNQLEKMVSISHRMNRQFGMEEWKQLHVKLQTWKKNVQSLMDTVRSARSQNNL